MPRSTVALLAIAAALVLAAPAHAVDPLVLPSTSPADRAGVPPTPTGGIPWRISAPAAPPDAMVSVTVSSSPATGAEGTLDTANRLDFFFLMANPVVPGAFSGLSDPGPNAWSADVGTYYWQVQATWTDAAGVFHSAASNVFVLGVGLVPPPLPSASAGAPAGRPSRTSRAMSSIDAAYYVRTVIRRHTKRTPVGLRSGCARLSARSFRCRPSWRDSRNIYSATATFVHTRSAGRIVANARFTGRRSSRRCARSRSVKRCARPFRWRSVVAAPPVPAAR